MNKKIIVVSYDDLWEGNDKWDVFEKFYVKFPKYKVTFFGLRKGKKYKDTPRPKKETA